MPGKSEVPGSGPRLRGRFFRDRGRSAFWCSLVRVAGSYEMPKTDEANVRSRKESSTKRSTNITGTDGIGNGRYGMGFISTERRLGITCQN